MQKIEWVLNKIIFIDLDISMQEGINYSFG